MKFKSRRDVKAEILLCRSGAISFVQVSDSLPNSPDFIEHPRFGRLERDGDRDREFDVPAFDAFHWPTSYPDTAPHFGRYQFGLVGFEYGDIPTKGGLDLIERVLDDPSRFVTLIINSLWDDFNGRGPDSGVWWHNNLSSVAKETVRDISKLQSPTDLLPWLRLAGVRLRYDCYWPEIKPLIGFAFWAAFEEEHGVEILSDGDKVVGHGFAIDVIPFDLIK